MKEYYVGYRLKDGTETFIIIRCEKQVEIGVFDTVIVDGTILVEIPGYIDTVEDAT